jgi:hypothetical protein
MRRAAIAICTSCSGTPLSLSWSGPAPRRVIWSCKPLQAYLAMYAGGLLATVLASVQDPCVQLLAKAQHDLVTVSGVPVEA